MCSIGACGCAPDQSHEVMLCECSGNACWDQNTQSCYTNPQSSSCEASGGTWTTLGNSCGDACIFYTGPSLSCAQVQTQGCDCGADMCWDTSTHTCIPNPTPTVMLPDPVFIATPTPIGSPPTPPPP